MKKLNKKNSSKLALKKETIKHPTVWVLGVDALGRVAGGGNTDPDLILWKKQ